MEDSQPGFGRLQIIVLEQPAMRTQQQAVARREADLQLLFEEKAQALRDEISAFRTRGRGVSIAASMKAEGDIDQ
jgi:hypothetical protein